MTIIDSLEWRYAVKTFDQTRKLTQQKVETIEKAFNLTATSFGLQPVTMLVISNSEIKEKLTEYSFNQQQINQSSHLLVLCIPKEYTSDSVIKYFERVKQVRNVTDEQIQKYRNFLISTIDSKSPEELFIWNKNQAYIAMGNLLTVCAVEKIDACPMEGFVPEKYDEILNLEEQNLTSVLVIPIGYRSENDDMRSLKKVRKDLKDSVVRIN